MKHSGKEVSELVQSSLIKMLERAAEQQVCPDCVLKELAVLVGLNVVVKEAAELKLSCVTEEHVLSFAAALSRSMLIAFMEMDSGSVEAQIVHIGEQSYKH